MQKSKSISVLSKGVYSWRESKVHAERMSRFNRAGIYLVTSRSLSAGRSTEKIVRDAVGAGATLIQLREKDISQREFYRLALVVRKITDDAGALLVINDRPDVAVASGADGVHLGQDDMPADAVRRMAPDLIIGVSTHSIREAKKAVDQGSSYINIGPVFPTGSKEGAVKFLGIRGLKSILSSGINIPFTVMGGIKKEHLRDLTVCGVRTVAVITAVTAVPDPGRAFADLLRHFRSCL